MGSLVSRSWICGPGVLESRSLSYGPLPQSFVRCGLLSFLWRVFSSSSDLICRCEVYLLCFYFFVFLGFMDVFLAQEISRSVRSVFETSWLDGFLNVFRSDYHLITQICVLGGGSKEDLFSVWSRLPDLFQQRSISGFQDIMGLFPSQVGFSGFFSSIWVPVLRTDSAALIAAHAYKEVCPFGWVLQPTLSCLSLPTLDIEEAVLVLDSTSMLIYVMNDGDLAVWFLYFLYFAGLDLTLVESIYCNMFVA